MSSNTSRRNFIRAAALTMGMPTITPASALNKNGTVAPHNRIVVGAQQSVRISDAMAAADQMIKSGKKNLASPLLDSIQSAVMPEYQKKAAASLSE